MLPPARFSPPLTPDYRSDFDRYLRAFRVAWQASRGYVLEDWQEDLLRRITEVCPEGHPRAGQLRYRQALVSMPRQQGKSELAAALGIWGLLRKRGALVIGIASSAEQSRIIYERTQQIIRGTPALLKRFEALTDTRGLRAKDGGRYELKASKSAALQGLPIDLGIVDEVHLVKAALWADLLNGTGSRPDCLIIGTTTAGDDSSELLKHLYALADSGEAGETYGYFIWEAPEAQIPEDDAELGALLLASNPALTSGRVPLDNVIADVRSMPPSDATRYRLNRFVATSDTYVGVGDWNSCRLDDAPEIPRRGVVFAVDRSPDWSYATVTASWRLDDGRTWTEVVASLTHPSPAALVEVAADLVGRYAPRAVVVDGYSLKSVGGELKLRGAPVTMASLADVAAASALFYANVVQKKLAHPGDPLLSVQLPGCRRRNVSGSESFRVARASGSMSIDAVMSTILGAYFAETLPDNAPQLFI